MRVAVLAIAMLLAGVSLVFPAESGSEGDDGFDKTTYLLDFSDYTEGSVESWLQTKGFTFERDAKNRSKLDLAVNDHALILEAKQGVFGILVNERVDVIEFSRIRIEWGVHKYPQGASYAKNVNNEALMIYIFFGYDKISSGSFLIPNSPYFIGLFLCEDEKVNFPYEGRYFQKGGRFVCLGKPKPGEMVISEFDLITAFQTYFEKDEIPVISGISLAIDTRKSKGGGKAAAFIKSVEFIE